MSHRAGKRARRASRVLSLLVTSAPVFGQESAAGVGPPPAGNTTSSGDDRVAEVVISGVRYSEQASVEIKRNAASIQDSISAEDIGKLPDTTISDSLQRITGVQINRSDGTGHVGGEGSSINIRGLPEIGTFLNGEAF